MANTPKPDFANGKICYIEIPASDVKASAEFYQQVFGWVIRVDAKGNIGFDDTVGQVSGMWVTGRKPAQATGFIVSIMVKDIPSTIELIKVQGGKIISTNIEAEEKTGLFADIFGNVWGLYQHQF